MRTPELIKQNNRLDQTLGEIGVRITNKIFNGVDYVGQEYIRIINERLGKGDSVLLVSDHPGFWQTIYTAGLVPQYLSNRGETGVLLKDAFVSGKMGLIGRMAIDILRRHAVEPLDVKTPKYEHNDKERTDYNLRSVWRCREILGEPRGLMMTFASGTRSRNMREAEDGLGYFSSRADLVIPLTTITSFGVRPKIVVHEPIPGKPGVEWCKGKFGIKASGLVFSDLVMNMIAVEQPKIRKRGFYREQAEYLERYMRNPTGIIPQTENLRVRRMIETYIAWRNGEFGK
jgi:hypothetical protein